MFSGCSSRITRQPQIMILERNTSVLKSASAPRHLRHGSVQSMKLVVAAVAVTLILR
jgi:hypothetical protein